MTANKKQSTDKKIMFSCSFLAADWTKLAAQSKAVTAAGADYIHLDIMDGHFVPNLALGFHDIDALRRLSHLPTDAHLMVERPDKYLDRFIENGCRIITIHPETLPRPLQALKKIRAAGLKAGIALNPNIKPQTAEAYLNHVDLVLQMTVFPGFYGQSFIHASLKNISALRRMIDARRKRILLQVDGGINQKTLPLVVKAGADFVVAGNAIFNHGPIRSSLARLRRIAADAAKETTGKR